MFIFESVIIYFSKDQTRQKTKQLSFSGNGLTRCAFYLPFKYIQFNQAEISI